MFDILNTKYSDLLQIIGLNNLQFTILVIIIILLTFFITFIIRLGVFHKVQIYQQRRKSMHILYKSYQGNYQQIGNQFQTIKTHMESLFFFSKCFGLYYDNPQKMHNKQLCRAVIGILVNQGQQSKVSLFMDNHSQYDECYLPGANYLITSFPYLNTLSFFLMIKKVYPKLSAKCKQLNCQTKSVAMQIYSFLPDEKKMIDFLCPLEKWQRFLLWEQPKKDL